MVSKIVSARKPPYSNTLKFPMCPKKTVSNSLYPHSRITISRLRLAKVWSYELPSGIPVRAKFFSFTWDWLEKRLRKRGTPKPLKKITRLKWSYMAKSSQ